jgi:hypothetical protein
MAKLHETDLSSPIFKKVAILRKERTFLVFFYATLGVCRGHSQGCRASSPTGREQSTRKPWIYAAKPQPQNAHRAIQTRCWAA